MGSCQGPSGSQSNLSRGKGLAGLAPGMDLVDPHERHWNSQSNADASLGGVASSRLCRCNFLLPANQDKHITGNLKELEIALLL